MAEGKFELFTSLRYDPALLEVAKGGFENAGWNSRNASPLYMLDYHRDRMLRAATHWGWAPAVQAIAGDAGLERLREFIASILVGKEDGPLRVKVTLSKDGEFGYELTPIPTTPLVNLFPSRLPPPAGAGAVTKAENGQDPQKSPQYEVVADLDKTPPSEYTHYKTTRRQMYDGARQRAGIVGPERKEVLIVNEDDGSIMEGSTTTPYFWRDGRWVTPPVSAEYSREAGSGGQDGTSRRWALARGLVVEEKVKAGSLVDGEECWLSSGVRGFICGRIKLRT